MNDSNNPNKGKPCIATCILFYLFPTSIRCEEWPHWRGLHRIDIVGEPSGWSEGKWSPRESWRVLSEEQVQELKHILVSSSGTEF